MEDKPNSITTEGAPGQSAGSLPDDQSPLDSSPQSNHDQSVSSASASQISGSNNSNGIKSSKKRHRDNATPAALTTALQAIHTTFATTFPAHAQLPAFQSLVHSYLTSKSSNLPQLILSNILNQIQVVGSKSLSDVPPYVHLSTRDAAPQLVIQDYRGLKKLSVRGGMRGFRMVRASQGVEAGCWYYEAVVMDPPSVSDVIDALPCNIRLGDGVREGLKKGLEKEQDEQTLEGASSASFEEGKKKRRKYTVSSTGVDQYGVGGHLRMGWSMRTGELQAPVGYDRWSYGIRDVHGSRIHNSKREDKWGGEGFGPGDVVGFAICLVDKDENHNSMQDDFNTSQTRKNTNPVTSNHIRFFKNGAPMGHFIVSRGVKTGGEAFNDIKSGTYYPAISSYMGGTARVNFGPHFICPPRGLPTGMKLRSMSEMCPAPMIPEKVLEEFKKEKFLGKRVETDIVDIIHKAVLMEANMRYEAYQKFRRDHVEEVRKLRHDRGAGTGDLPPSESAKCSTPQGRPMDVKSNQE